MDPLGRNSPTGVIHWPGNVDRPLIDHIWMDNGAINPEESRLVGYSLSLTQERLEWVAMNAGLRPNRELKAARAWHACYNCWAMRNGQSPTALQHLWTDLNTGVGMSMEEFFASEAVRADRSLPLNRYEALVLAHRQADDDIIDLTIGTDTEDDGDGDESWSPLTQGF